MAMAHKAPPGYRRKLIIGHAVLNKARLLVRDLAHWPGGELGNYIDFCVISARASPENTEVWWEDTFAYGIQRNEVIDLQHHLVQAKGTELFALVTTVAEGGMEAGREIVVTILSPEDRARAIDEGRWVPERPLQSKFRHPGEVELEGGEMEGSSSDEPEFAVSWPARGEDGEPVEKFEIVRDPKVAAGLLVGDGVRPDSIRVWRNVRAKIKVEVEL